MFSKIFPKIHAEGYKFLVIAGIITIVFYIFSDFLGLIGLVLSTWVYYFFASSVSPEIAFWPTFTTGS